MGWAGNTYYGVDQWIETESNWDSSASLFKKNNIMELRFEDLVLHPKRQLKRVCNFMGVEYSSAMLSYSTESTYDPPDASTVTKWKTQLRAREIALVEIKARSLLLQRDYELSGCPLDYPTLFECIQLWWANKVYKWRFGIRRHGLINFVLEKITRRLLKPFHHVFAQRMHQTDRSYLK
jgi:hypothetical protein